MFPLEIYMYWTWHVHRAIVKQKIWIFAFVSSKYHVDIPLSFFESTLMFLPMRTVARHENGSKQTQFIFLQDGISHYSSLLPFSFLNNDTSCLPISVSQVYSNCFNANLRLVFYEKVICFEQKHCIFFLLSASSIKASLWFSKRICFVLIQCVS